MVRNLLFALLLGTADAAAAAPTLTVPVPATAVAGFTRALAAYEAGEFTTAVALLERTLASEPGCARCAHLLGKSYGRLAERAGWLQAMAYARKTHSALEQAAALAPYDREVLEDLIRYYRAAPAFLGGSREKAEQLERRLHDATEQTSRALPAAADAHARWHATPPRGGAVHTG